MNKPIKNILCFDKISFDQIMEDKGWKFNITDQVSVISICSGSEGEWSKHWFPYDKHDDPIKYDKIFNLDIDDISPFWFENHESECYDKSLELYMDGHIKQSNAYFNNCYINGQNKEFFDILHALDYEEAFDLVDWIDYRIKKDNTIYIHCAAGASRSQGVVRYIVDTYQYTYDIRLNPYNPNNTYNPHVVMMLKRAYRNSDVWDNPCDEYTYFYTKPMKDNNDIKLNFI